MSRIAQKLCDEIVEPALKPSKDSTTKKSSSKYLSQCPSKQDSKTTRSIIIEKRKVINKLDPNDSNASRTKFKSKETLLKKKFADISVNTLITGPLRCDNDCVTMVRKRDNSCSCKCAQKRLNYKASAKQIQTFRKNLSLTDKACAQCIETASCGTQFIEQLKPQSSTGTKRSNKDIKIYSSLKDSFRIKNEESTIQSSLKDSSRFKHDEPAIQSSLKDSSRIRSEESTSSRPAFLNFMGARRWALSQYPTRGPDF